jgi:hypothetical protein
MVTKYNVYNPKTGEHTSYPTKDQAIQAFWQIHISMVMANCNNTMYMQVDTMEDGSEIWRNDDSVQIDKPMSSAEIHKLFAENNNPYA